MPPRHVYVHVPFCTRRCSYCDFSIAVRRSVPVRDYVDAVGAELDQRVASPPTDAAGDTNDTNFGPWPVDTLYLGGGTPSLLGADGVAQLLDRLGRHLAFDASTEITIEANPDDVTPSAARVWIAHGVNRLSLGAQSFDDRALAWMHRTHAASGIRAAVEAARAAGFENISLDLIFSLPEELARDWTRDVREALALAPTHVSLYGLTIEPATPLGRWRDRGQVREAPEDAYEREFLLAHDLLGDAGFEHYEVSNWARPGWRSRHNAAYWRRVPYLGIGPAAHSFDERTRRWNIAAYAEWVRAVAAGRDPVGGTELLGDPEVAAERVYLGLRTTNGLPLDDAMLADATVARRVQSWVAAGWAALVGGRLSLTATGWLRLDALAADLTMLGSH